MLRRITRAPGYLTGGFLTVALLAGSALLGSADAAEAECLPDSVSEGFAIVPIRGATRSEVQEQAANTWDDWIWKGDLYVCNDRAIDCEYQWNQVKTTTTSLTVGIALNLGNNNSPAGKWWNYAQSILPSFGRTTEVTTDFHRLLVLKPGQTARPVQIATRRWRRGTFRGGYFKLTASPPCTDGGATGHWYWKSTERPWGNWSDNVVERTWATYEVDAKVTGPIP
ncbi:MAG TPA: hypothetical protein VI248_17140 [Kineosporiaceae bacterium]